ncbi:hypothetical protein ANCCEY_08453 [Ancylostoma ceylanicum]|uniref:Uncharacterized protein n=1 Tax=Ancylostoma ceylanicum TaxID=53326 RepID=A0A0D6LK50_9BILA|nr:hypothetical protein ANCCEY_08453 [Ancylostoma ceylanicum]
MSFNFDSTLLMISLPFLTLVDSLELPAITICPKVPDAFNSTGLLADIQVSLPGIDDVTAIDLVNGFPSDSKFSYTVFYALQPSP